jgi:glutamate dehydrogenase (NAD(P)+)
MEEQFQSADELGPAKIFHVQEPSIGLRATLVVDNVACGPSIGGLRMAADVTTEECFRLARAMTLKNAAAGLAHGGGKSVLTAVSAKCILPREAALDLALRRLKRTMGYRRFSIF